MCIRALSIRYKFPEKVIADDIKHIKKSISHRGKLMIKPAECINCGFVFKEREKIKSPSKCPECKSERIMECLFMIVEK
ncbi:MAG: transcriptional regulator [Candidatus Altiarchaeum hamiconexum]|uniref:Transcriptional regulator n=1 Tax=Candidatus Altarchaeum hamiconexum TaxID=1803513 RepID=A0A8J7YUB3_9ARCH|nr:transcriptional regulator [Candidatus Altarchaeum hamiconexum]PIN66956.1 MAG: transcriptional regulator [Candidatus Altarchaeum sp. CG12_big_fil_rev_8_21_14_0_65_33_22]PIV27899.1 MAG: transcriptional regulator [Candidatus Altarchaeum sp. CG03_land_8_20_14_0_80_32_618]PIX48358.1 MAG: transcriptional regulator [Candidatus Altarchaeum sp. CG_4_8_14_3_um_filter_33_2054]PIZ29237.1 MAG: transcriptional regulator [Candidatus Altarchaeum sp. CG_4_10_14_0_8_um_filter_32_851]PJC13725.1 MAG: transcrip